MPESDIFLDYQGPIDLSVIDLNLANLKKTKEFKLLDKVTGKRVYGLLVECLENIYKHSALKSSDDPGTQPHFSVGNEKDKVIIRAGNPVSIDAKHKLVGKLDQINTSDREVLKTLHETKIKHVLEKGANGAGLGFIHMALKSGNRIIYSFRPLDNQYLYFEIQISINKYIMRKLIIDPTFNSPKVALDPEKKIFQISGESRPSDVREFYDQVLSWLDEFSSHLIKSDDKNDPVTFDFNFEYFNSSSGKLILDICKILAGLNRKGFNIVINWHFEKDDVDMLEAGTEMSKILKFPFEYMES